MKYEHFMMCAFETVSVWWWMLK